MEIISELSSHFQAKQVSYADLMFVPWNAMLEFLIGEEFANGGVEEGVSLVLGVASEAGEAGRR